MKSIIDIQFKPQTEERLSVEVLDIEDLIKKGSKNHFSQWFRADFFRLYVVQSGVTRPMVDFVQKELRPGDWMLVHPGQVLKYDFSNPWAAQLVVFQRTALWEDRLAHTQLAPLSAQLALAEGGVWHAQELQHQRMLQDVQMLRGGMAENHPLPVRNELLSLQLTALLLRLMSISPEIQSPSTQTAQAYARFALLLEEQFASQHQVAYYANRLGMHAKTLGRVVQARNGAQMSVKKQIAQRILLEAKRLLAHTAMPVQTIGLTLGFEDPSNFIKFFRKCAGQSPLAFRQSVA